MTDVPRRWGLGPCTWVVGLRKRYGRRSCCRQSAWNPAEGRSAGCPLRGRAGRTAASRKPSQARETCGGGHRGRIVPASGTLQQSPPTGGSRLRITRPRRDLGFERHPRVPAVKVEIGWLRPSRITPPNDVTDGQPLQVERSQAFIYSSEVEKSSVIQFEGRGYGKPRIALFRETFRLAGGSRSGPQPRDERPASGASGRICQRGETAPAAAKP
ncbi:hypothetical protein SKAU_G00381110 [Synaphobranchus kaupii]|uniref:Uncharacterized protein n=1 Tax=Synaphobranchus kaupii TaxID=118154 RepID=A0A9Q1EDN6_SYNKA|nr:hypothetical protein SKAU_G00381110 [Synaphobranchus kaupii]